MGKESIDGNPCFLFAELFVIDLFEGKRTSPLLSKYFTYVLAYRKLLWLKIFCDRFDREVKVLE